MTIKELKQIKKSSIDKSKTPSMKKEPKFQEGNSKKRPQRDKEIMNQRAQKYNKGEFMKVSIKGSQT